MPDFIDTLSFNMLIISLEYADELTPPVPRILQINRAAAELLGYSAPELIGQPLAQIFATEKAMALWQAALVKMNTGVTDSGFEVDLLTQAQLKMPALLAISPVPSQSAKNTMVAVLIQVINLDNQRFMMRRVVEQSASAVMITDRSGRIDYINPKFTELTGYTCDELLDKNPKLLQSGQMSIEHYQSMWDTLINKGEWRGELQNQKKNGDVYWAYESISAIRNSAGEITHFLAVEEDITNRKAVELALSESEERFRQMAEMAGEWLWEQDPAGYYSYSSNAVQQILGFSPEKVIGKHYTEFLTAQDKSTQQNYTSSQSAFYALINHYQHKDGQTILTESTGLPIFNAQGKLLKWRGVDRDITARMHFQDALIESEKRTRLIIESSINAIILVDSYGIISDWNHRAEKMFGWLQADAIGQRLDDLIVPSRFRSVLRKGLSTFLLTGVAPILNKQTEQIALRRDGTEFPVEVSVSPLKLGNAYIFSGFIHDISGRKAAEQQIRQAQVNLAIAQNEIKIAQQIQISLFPSAPIQTAAIEVIGFCLPADKIGGDYYDYFYRNEAKLDLVIADVSGHSIGPALFMVETRSAIRVHNNHAATPAETLGVLNNFLFNDLDNSDYFITLFYLQVDLKQQQISFANAGHPPPLLLTRGEFTALDAEGLILGVRKAVNFEEKTCKLTKGDLILFYTDGIIETENQHKEFFGLERLKAVLLEHAHEPTQSIIDSLFAALQAFCERDTFNDDITLMIFKWGGG